MPRARRTAEVMPLPDDDAPIVDSDQVADDPQPRAARAGRPRKVVTKAAGNRGRIPARATGGRIASEAQMVAKVKAEVHMWLAMAGGAWELADPECASVLTLPTMTGGDRIEEIADTITAMIARNKTMLTYAAKTGVIGEAIKLLVALLPIGKAVWQAHGPNGHGHRSQEEMANDYAQQYPAWSGATAG